MKRRLFVQALAAIPAAAQVAPQAAPQTTPQTAQDPKLESSVAEFAADAMPHFFTPPQLEALRRVSDLLMPATNTSPGALAAGAPEFLDFLIGASGPDRQRIYKAGLDGLNAQAQKQFSKAFENLDNSQADILLAPLHAPWTFDEPTEPVARFLRVAKVDMRTATVNSRPSAAGRRIAGSGLYWYPLD
jgi:hypothetical protein